MEPVRVIDSRSREADTPGAESPEASRVHTQVQAAFDDLVVGTEAIMLAKVGKGDTVRKWDIRGQLASFREASDLSPVGEVQLLRQQFCGAARGLLTLFWNFDKERANYWVDSYVGKPIDSGPSSGIATENEQLRKECAALQADLAEVARTLMIAITNDVRRVDARPIRDQLAAMRETGNARVSDEVYLFRRQLAAVTGGLLTLLVKDDDVAQEFVHTQMLQPDGSARDSASRAPLTFLEDRIKRVREQQLFMEQDMFPEHEH